MTYLTLEYSHEKLHDDCPFNMFNIMYEESQLHCIRSYIPNLDLAVLHSFTDLIALIPQKPNAE